MPVNAVLKHNSTERAMVWGRVFQRRAVPVVSAQAVYVRIPEYGDAWCYQVDVGALDEGQRERLVLYLAEEFRQPVDEVREYLDADGCPVPVDGVVIVGWGVR